jgi:transcriptional regulator of acetoin/glycerol metabolism
MSWSAVVEALAHELGPEVASHVDRIVRRAFRGTRLTIPARAAVTPEQAAAVAPGRPREAARKLGVHPSTVYRILRARRTLIR